MGNSLLHGLLIGASLIVAIGAQNAFVLRQGLRREHGWLVAGICAVCDLLLVASGVAGLGPAGLIAVQMARSYGASQVVGIDLLVAAVNDYASGSAYEMSQEDAGMVCRFPEPADMQGVARQLQGPGGCRKADRSYPLWKLFGRFIVLTPWLVIRNWYRRLTATFPVASKV